MQYRRFDIKSQNVSIPSLQLNLLYWEHCTKEGNLRGSFHFHDFWQAELVVLGKLSVKFTDQIITVEQHQALIIPPGIRHSIEYSSGKTEFFSFKFSCFGAEKIERPMIFDDETNIFPLRQYIMEFLAKDQMLNQKESIHIQNALKTLLELELFFGEEIKPRTIAEQVRELLVIINDSFPSVEFIADKLGFSRPYLSKRIKEETGLSLKPFLDNERIRLAKNLLLMSDLSISDISYHLGFQDLCGFSKFFSRLTKTNPRSYRQQIYSKDIYKN